jgi:predicted Ser/Thr protein kinase
MKRKSHIESFLEHTEKLNISGVSESKLNNPHQMLVGSQYKITEPDYDEDGTEINKPYIVEVVKKMKHGFILRDTEHDFTFERTFQHLMTCEIEEV